MALLKLISIFLLSTKAFAIVETKLPILLTKQSIFNLRWVSFDGERTYYQRTSGDLILSTRYRVIEILKGKKNTHYNVISTHHRNYIAFLKDEDFHDWMGIRHLKSIYASDFKSESAPAFIGKGISPKLHLKDEWLSYYDPFTRIIHFRNLKHQVLKFEIALKNQMNPYFIPEVAMIDKDSILYTDINDRGLAGILLFKKLKNKISPVFKLKDIREKIEFCKRDNDLYIGVFGTAPSRKTSDIFSLNTKPLNFKKLNTLYSKKDGDLGNLVCDHKKGLIYFTKNTTPKNGKESYDIATLDTKTKKVNIVSDLTYATEVINLDGRLVIPYRGNFFVLHGEENLRKDDIFKL